MGKRLIQPVSDNKDKQRTYAENMAKYKKAMTGEFYFEAMLIDYAMLEDRLRSFLYYIALLKDRESYKADNRFVKTRIKAIVAEHKDKDENDSLSISSISGKSKKSSDPYHASDFSYVEDFYDEYYDDFFDIDDAEDYYMDHYDD